MAEVINAQIDGPRSTQDLRWYNGEDEAHARLFAAKKRVYDDDASRRNAALHHLRMYDSRYARSLGGDLPLSTAPDRPSARLKYNAVKSVVETAVSRLGRNRPKAQFLPSGGNWGIHKQSKRLGKYVEGVFDGADVYTKGRQAFRDGCITGTGLLKFFPEKKKSGWGIGCERVFPWELLVDDVDGRTGDPQNIMHLHFCSRTRLFEKYKDTKKWKRKHKQLAELLREAEEGDLGAIGRANVTDTVEVVEAYRKPSYPGAGDGKHMIAVSSTVLFEEEWDEDWFPIVQFVWNHSVVGYWGGGITQTISGTQVHINRLLGTLSKAYKIFANPILAIHRDSRILEDRLDNHLGRVIKFSTQPPMLIAHKPLNDQFLSVLAQLKQDAFEISGVSQLAAINRKPAELESGEALRQFNDINDARHADPALNYEAFFMSAAKVVIGLSRRMAKMGMAPRAMAPFRRRWRSWVEPIEWSSVKMAEDQFALQVYPTSILPSTPAGRTATVQEWLRAGFIDQQTAHYLLEIPDLDSYASPDLIMYEAILSDIEAMLDDGQPRMPEPRVDLELTSKLATAAYLRARTLEAPDEVLELLLEYLDGVDRHMALRDQEVAAQQPAGPTPEQQIPDIASIQAGIAA